MTGPLIDFSAPVQQLRALIPDVEKLVNPNRPGSPAEYMFSDEHLAAFLAINPTSLRLAAADAVEALGTSEGLIAKVIKTEDLETDGAKLMAQFLQRGRLLREQARNEVINDSDSMVIVPFNYPLCLSAPELTEYGY